MSDEPAHPLVSRPQRRAFQRKLEKGRAALNPANLLAAVEKLNEGKRRKLAAWLGVPNAKLDEVEFLHYQVSDRAREIFSYFLRLDPDASWRSVVRALDWMGETSLADRLRPLTEPITDPTFTVEAVAAALQKVGHWGRVADWLEVPVTVKDSIYTNHSTHEKQKKALAEYIVNSLPGASWSLLASPILHLKEKAALDIVRNYLQKKHVPSLTLPNLLSLLERRTSWFKLGSWMGVPTPKLEAIRSRSPSDSEGLEAVMTEWLEDHPAPSWRGLAWALYGRADVLAHAALQVVYDKYLTAPPNTRRMAALNGVMKTKGAAVLKTAQGAIMGFPRAGKTSLMLRLLGKPAEKQTSSTGVAEKVMRIEISAVRISGKNWKPITDLHEEAADLVDKIPEEMVTAVDTQPAGNTTLVARPTSTSDETLSKSSSACATIRASPREQLQPDEPNKAADTLEYFEDAFAGALRKEKQALTDEDRFTLYLTDSGGQPEFQGLLRNMVSGPSLFFIVFRLDQKLSQPFTVEYQHPDGSMMTPYDTTLTTKEALLQFLATISSVGSFTKTENGREVRIKPKAMFIGTHRDKITEKEFREYDQELRKLIKTTDSCREGIIEFASESQLILPINNLSEDDTEITNIRLVVERVCQRGSDYEVEIPYPTLILGIGLRFLKDPVISYDYCFERAQQCGIDTTDDLDDALWFLHHRVGLVRHFSDFPELQKLVILSPQYIFDKVTELIVSTFTFEKTDWSIQDEFRSKGIFPFDTFVKLASSEEQFISPDQLTCLLERLHVIAPIANDDGGAKKYFAPCVLAHAPSPDESAKTLSDMALPPLVISFKSGYCPTGLFGVLVVHLLSNRKKTCLQWSLEEDRIYHNYITLSVGPYDTFSFRVLPSHMRIEQVWSAKKRKVSLEEVCGDIRCCIENSLNEVIRLLSYTHNAEHQLAFPCPAAGHSDAALVKYFNEEPTNIVCSHDKNKRFDLPPRYEAWFHKRAAQPAHPVPPVDSEKQSTSPKPVSDASLPELEHENRKMEYTDLVRGKKIGKGTTGTVFKGSWKEWDIAIKVVEYTEKVEKEIQSVSLLKHPNIIKLYGTVIKDSQLYIALELAECSLYDHMQQAPEQPDMELSLRWAAEIAEGMRYLHEKEVVHRDLKSLNVLLTFKQTAKLCDFDTARHLEYTAQASRVGTCAWMAPEVIEDEPYSKRCDLFSYGIVLWELVTHEVPFKELKSNFKKMKAITEGNMPPISKSLDGYLSSLIRKCWDRDPKKRPSFVEALSILKSKAVAIAGLPVELEHGNRRMNFTDVVLGTIIGTGGFGTVFEGRWKLLEGPVAIKRLMLDDEKEKKEAFILGELKHPNIIKLYGTTSHELAFYIITELAKLGSLQGHIEKNKGKPDMELSLHWAAGVARGMSYLHEKDVVHRDLKSANVLLTSEKTAKICDFGVARKMSRTTKATLAGTYPWMAPEVISEEAYSKRCDIFSYGTVLWELVTHGVPFEELNQVPYHIQAAIVDGNMPTIPKTVEDYITTLIQSCWKIDPQNRPSFPKILSVLEAAVDGNTDV